MNPYFILAQNECWPGRHQQRAPQLGGAADADALVAQERAAAACGAVGALHPGAAPARELHHHARDWHTAAQHCATQDSWSRRARVLPRPSQKDQASDIQDSSGSTTAPSLCRLIATGPCGSQPWSGTGAGRRDDRRALPQPTHVIAMDAAPVGPRRGGTPGRSRAARARGARPAPAAGMPAARSAAAHRPRRRRSTGTSARSWWCRPGGRPPCRSAPPSGWVFQILLC